MNMFKKFMAVLLAVMMVFSLAACAGGSENGDTTPSDSQPQAGGENSNSGEKRVITIGLWWDIYYDSTHTALEDDPAYVGSEADQMRFDIVKKIEETYNVEFQYVNLTYTGITESINNSILAGTPDCDIYMCDLTMGIPAAMNNLAVDLKTILPGDADVLSTQQNLNYLDLGDGKACLMKQVRGENVVADTYPLAFNKQMLEDAGLEDPRELYARGEWTWDKFVEYCQTLTQDTDGDGVTDQYGFTGFKEDVVRQLMLSNGASIASGDTQTLDSNAVTEALQFYSDLYNVYNVCEPYTWEDNGDVMRFSYRNGHVAFWPSAAWIAASNADYDWDGSTGVTLDFDTVYVQWPVGYSGNKETNKGELTGGSFWFIPVGVEDPELVYNVFEMLTNWYCDDIELRDDIETMWWWYASTAKEEQIQYDNYDVMFDMGSKEQFDLYPNLGVQWDLESLINGSMTAAQFVETYKNEFQAAIDAYFG